MEPRVAPCYDPAQFDAPIYEVEHIRSITAPLRDGIYHCKFPDSLDFYISRFEDAPSIDTICVCFNAAVDHRPEKCGPFFSGRGLAASLKLPLISIADPLVSSTNLSIAWYSGHENCVDFQKELAYFLDRIAEKYNARLIIFGGSGGGFAALAISQFLRAESTLVASNPQTSISKYIFTFARDYVTTAFPAAAKHLNCSDLHTATDKIAQLHYVLEESRIIHDVTKLDFGANVKIVYLQNKTDWHVNSHTAPFIRGRKWTPVGQNSLMSKNIGIYFGSWGKGHVSPGMDILAIIVRKVSKLRSIKSILTDLENGLTGLNPNKGSIIFLNSAQYKLVPCFHVGETTITAECSVLRTGIAFQNSELLFSFYLMDDSRRVETRHYSKDPTCEFRVPEKYNDLYIRCFVRDKFHQTLSATGVKVNKSHFVNLHQSSLVNNRANPKTRNRKNLQRLLKFTRQIFHRK